MSTSLPTPAAERPAGTMPTLKETREACATLNDKSIFKELSRFLGEGTMQEIPLEALNSSLLPALQHGEGLEIFVYRLVGMSDCVIQVQKHVTGPKKCSSYDNYRFKKTGGVLVEFVNAVGNRNVPRGEAGRTENEPALLPLSAVLSALEKLNGPEASVAETRASAAGALQGGQAQ